MELTVLAKGPVHRVDRPDTARYIASLADELARLARRHDLNSLAYILDMARLEAAELSTRLSGTEGESP